MIAHHNNLARGIKAKKERLQTLRRRRDQLKADLLDAAYDRPANPNRKVRRHVSFDAMLAKFVAVKREIEQIEGQLSKNH